MITLHLMGGARLEGEDGPLRGEPAQRHRIALLALLALAEDHRLPREKALGLLWPEHGPREARHLLNVTVYVLRKALGRETIRSEGDALVLDSHELPCDAVDFRRALERGDARRAVELYGGPFLESFYLGGSNAFDDWQELRRRELEDLHVAALRTVAREAGEAGDRPDATSRLREVLRLRPMDAEATIALMRLLEASGDRAGALGAADDHAAALAQAFDAEPTPEVDALARRIRDRPRSGAGNGEEPAVVSAGAASGSGADEPPDSHVRERPDQTGARDRPTSTRRRVVGPALALVSVIVAPLALFVALGSDDGREATPPPAPTSVAVLPFADMSPDGDRTWFSDGLTEELLTALAQTPGLRVAARSSAFRFRGSEIDVRGVGEALDVATVVEGSVRVEGERLRVTARLIDATTGHQVWSTGYDRRMDDVFAVQEDLARALATELSAEIGTQLPDTLVTTTTGNPAAYRLYLRGRHEWRQRTEAGMWSALEAFQGAVALDPGYAGAYAGLADTWQLLPDYGDVEAAEAMARAKTAALRAVALDSTLAEGHVALGALLDDYDHDRTGAEAAYRRAIDLNPGYATARHWLAIHLADEGRFEEALEQVEIARRLDPLSDIVNTAAGAVRYFARDYEGALAEYRAVLDVRPDFALGWALLGRVQLVDGRVSEAVESLERSVELSDGDPSYRAVYAAALAEAGRTDEARSLAADVWAPHPDGYVPYCELASAYIRLGREEQAIELFRQAFDELDPALKHIRAEPLYDALRGYPAFEELVARAGFADS